MKKKITLIVLISIVAIGLGYAIYSLNSDVADKKKKIAELEKASMEANKRYNRLMDVKDSMLLVNAFLAKYRTLTVAMTYRDSVRLSLKYKIGDVVHLKRDSSRVIVSDIIVGGGKHEYYLKYKVLFSSGKEEDVVQELLY